MPRNVFIYIFHFHKNVSFWSFLFLIFLGSNKTAQTNPCNSRKENNFLLAAVKYININSMHWKRKRKNLHAMNTCTKHNYSYSRIKTTKSISLFYWRIISNSHSMSQHWTQGWNISHVIWISLGYYRGFTVNLLLKHYSIIIHTYIMFQSWKQTQNQKFSHNC